jgi:hypothetical protein
LLNAALGSFVPASKLPPTVSPIAANIWGVPVTKALRDAIQVAEGLSSGKDDEANMPSLPASVIEGIMTGQIIDWTQVTDSLNNPLPSAPGVTPPSETGVYWLRRPDSSGTMTSFKVMFGNLLCAAGTANVQTDPGIVVGTTVVSSSTPCGDVAGSGVETVSSFQSTGTLLGCLGTVNKASFVFSQQVGTNLSLTTAVGTGPIWAIGMASSTNNPCPGSNLCSSTSTTDAGWRWIKINNVAATLVNSANAFNPYFTEAVIEYNKTALGTTDAAVADDLAAQLTNPNVLSAIDSSNTGSGGFQQYGGFYTGVMVPASAAISLGLSPTYPLTVANVLSNPMLTSTRNLTGANSCQPPVNILTVPLSTNGMKLLQ